MSTLVSTAKLHRDAYQLRQMVLTMIYQAQSGHPASSLGLADVFATLYLGQVLRVDAKRPEWPNRDYLLVSNGHIAALWYATLAKMGFFPDSELTTFRRINSRLQGHPHFLPSGTMKVPGIENTSGPLGQGLSQAAGIALALQRAHRRNWIWCLMSDGEQQEGQIWEAYQFIAAYQLNHLIGLIDCNNIQISGPVSKVMPLGNLKVKLLSFGFRVLEVDAHDFRQLQQVFAQAQTTYPQATIILLHSTPGKGVAFMENDYRWHGKAPNASEYHQALKELQIKEKNHD